MIQLYNRTTKKLEEENVLGGRFLSLLYEKPYGKPLLFFVKRKFFSAFYGKLMDTRWSKKLIPSFMENNGLNSSDLLDPLSSFQSFNEFFARKQKNLHALLMHPVTSSSALPMPGFLSLKISEKMLWSR